MAQQKPLHTIVLDTGSIIRNEPSVSTLLNQSGCIVTVPAVIAEIKDAPTRSRVESTLLPFLTLRSPSPASVKIVTDFSRRTGDLAVLSAPDVQIIALAYEVECERNGGDWRLRRVPGQKRVNGAPPSKAETTEGQQHTLSQSEVRPEANNALESLSADPAAGVNLGRISTDQPRELGLSMTKPIAAGNGSNQSSPQSNDDGIQDVCSAIAASSLVDEQQETPKTDSVHNSAESQEDTDSDSEGWITPSNLKKKQAEDAASSTTETTEPKTMQVAVLTTDFAMQNVILQMNLNLISPSLTRIKHLKTFVLRCHACFQVTEDMSKQFCPRCGQPSLTRVSCSTSANGEFKLHLKKNMQWNNRGDRYSIPKPVHGSANGRVKGGGKAGWGNDLILAEDQKEYQRAARDEKKTKERNLMDEDYLPSILTGDRGRTGGRIKVGAGRNVNAKKR